MSIKQASVVALVGAYFFTNASYAEPNICGVYYDAVPREEIRSRSGALWACDGRGCERLVCRRSRGVARRGTDVPGFFTPMMIGGAVGFYLGIDTPQLPFHSTNGQPSKADEKIDTAEFLSALGTFLAGFSSFAAVGMIVLRHDPHIAWTTMIMAGWVIGVAMQITAGAMARLRR